MCSTAAAELHIDSAPTCTVYNYQCSHGYSVASFHILTEPVRFTDTNVYGTGSVKIYGKLATKYR